MQIVITDEMGNSISSYGNPKKEDNSVLYTWNMPSFKEIHVGISRMKTDRITGYVILGIY